jgi:hypothetical protein
MSVRLRCDDVTRELAEPTAGRDPVALAEHLAACPHCAARAGRDARLALLWDATRPAEPAQAAWDALWAGLVDRLDRTAARAELVPARNGSGDTLSLGLGLASLPAGRWRRWGVLAFGLAQAAAVLVAACLLASQSPHEARADWPKVDIEPGQLVLIQDIGRRVQVIELASVPTLDQIPKKGQQEPAIELVADWGNSPNTLDSNFALFNAIEAMASVP